MPRSPCIQKVAQPSAPDSGSLTEKQGVIGILSTPNPAFFSSDTRKKPRPKKSLLFHQTQNKALEDFWWVSEKKKKLWIGTSTGLKTEVQILAQFTFLVTWQRKKKSWIGKKKRKKLNWHENNRETMPWYKIGDREVIIVCWTPNCVLTYGSVTCGYKIVRFRDCNYLASTFFFFANLCSQDKFWDLPNTGTGDAAEVVSYQKKKKPLLKGSPTT